LKKSFFKLRINIKFTFYRAFLSNNVIMKKILLLAVIFLSCNFWAQTPTVGLIQSSPDTYEGYTLLAPMFCPAANCPTYLINNCGEKVYEWPTTAVPGLNAYLLPDGKLLRAYATAFPSLYIPGKGGALQLWDTNGNIIWDYIFADSLYTQHHEVTYMPNGNILIQVVVFHDSLECVAKGRNPATITEHGIFSDQIIELSPVYPNSAQVVWKWDTWDHLVQNFDNMLPAYGQADQHPELFDLNYLGISFGGTDWLHTNSIDYNPSLDQIVMSSRHMSEIYIIDHSTNTQEAATHAGGNQGKGGDILYRWGNPIAYGKGTSANQRLYCQHNAHWISDGLNGAGKLMIFNNGAGRLPVEHSAIDLVDPNPDVTGNYTMNAGGTFDPDTAEWSYAAPNPADFFAMFISGAQRLENGNTLICDGTHGTIFEIDTIGAIVWKYILPVTFSGPVSQGATISNFPTHGTANWIFRAPKYGPNYSGIQALNLNNQGPIELNPYPSGCLFVSVGETNAGSGAQVYPNPANDRITLRQVSGVSRSHFAMRNSLGSLMNVTERRISEEETEFDLSGLEPGFYFLEMKDSNGTAVTLRIVKTN
jgi:hypothetical protein